MQTDERLGLCRIMAFSLPILLMQAIGVSWRSYLPAFLVGTIGLSFAAGGAVLLALRLFDTVADPAIGWLSDRSRRRKPWMATGALLAAVGAPTLYFAPPGTSLLAIVAAGLMLHLGYSLVITPHGGWSMELGRTSHDRTRMMAVRGWYGGAGGILVLLVMALLERRFDIGLSGLMAALAIMIALLTPLSVGFVLARFAEDETRMDGCAANPLALLRDLLRDRRAVTIFALYALTGVAEAAGNTMFLFLAEHVLKLGGWTASLLMIPLAMLLVTIPLWTEISRRIGRERALAIVYLWQCLVPPLILLIPEQHMAMLVAYLLLCNLTAGADYMLLRSLLADLAVDAAQAGERRAGSYFGLANITLKLAMGAGAAGALWAAGMAGFSLGKPVSAPSDLAIRLAYAGPAWLAALAGCALLRVSFEKAKARWFASLPRQAGP